MLKIKASNDKFFLIIVIVALVVTAIIGEFLYIPISLFFGCLGGSFVAHRNFKKLERDDLSIGGVNLVLSLFIYVVAAIIPTIFFGVIGYVLTMIGLIMYRQRLYNKIGLYEGGTT